MENLVITINDYKFINHNNSHFVTQFNGKLLNGVIKKDPYLIILDGSMHIKSLLSAGKGGRLRHKYRKL